MTSLLLAYFGDNDYPSMVDKEILPLKMVISFWSKKPRLVLQNQINNMVKPEDLNNLKRVDLTTGGFFRILLRMLLHF